ncbi:hypothetical protein [Phreatobacter sp. AB_2022a]|uniref:hypothetical protein n=1 Tax=Phreatobacter sp. AB_2022a TaxID=3003134 RepID=UPI00228723FA|nr:hypothetical protein [Phreatobacter sp. AB_2022a]MCZ0737955.1 hypothetical protein [Phreatobacter sp. AB_2022a]
MERPFAAGQVVPAESSQSAVSWGAIIAGALAAATITVILMLVGSGLGLTIVSPWPGQGAGLTTFAASTAVGLVVIQWLSSAVGGYLAGRLRTEWVGLRSDEVFFRDTVHGFMAWALATLLMVGTVGAGLTTVAGGGARATAAAASGATSAAADMAGNSGAVAYYVDNLLRPNDPSSLAGQPDGRAKATAEITRILAQSAVAGSLGTDDKAYLARLIAANTGLSEQEANARIDALLVRIEEAKTKAREAADAARKAGAAFALASALALLIGAFIAGVAAAVAGRQRDETPDLATARY